MRRPSHVSRVIDLLVSSERVDAMVVYHFLFLIMGLLDDVVVFFVFHKSRKNETGS